MASPNSTLIAPNYFDLDILASDDGYDKSVCHDADELFRLRQDRICLSTDRLFVWLMAFQWAACIVAALVISPTTWFGTRSEVDSHVWFATILGGLIASAPIYFGLRHPGVVITRHVIAVSQMLMSALIIDLTGGRIESHFHIFASLAFLAFYRDWRVLVTATVVIVLHHLIGGLYFSKEVFGVADAGEWRWVEHTAWIIFADFFLILSCLTLTKEMRWVAVRQATLSYDETLLNRSNLKKAHDELASRLRELEEAHEEAAEYAAELHQMVLRSDQLLASIPSILIGVDRMGQITLWNDSAQINFGKAAFEVVGKPFVACQIQWDSAKLHDAIQTCAASRDIVRLDDFVYTKNDGSDAILGITLKPICSEQGGEPTGVLISAADITQKRMVEAQLVQAQKLESIGQLAAGIAHEINTPLQYVGDNVRFLKDSFTDINSLLVRYSDLLKSDYRQEDIIEGIRAATEKADIDYVVSEIPNAIRDSEDGVQRVVEIVQAMRAFSHPGSDQKTSVSLNRALESAITVSRNEWKFVADVTTDFDENLRLVPCLAGELNQVFLNIIINASHAISDAVGDGSSGKGTIGISTSTDGVWAEVRISDSGTGIPEEIKSKIFDPFFTTKGVGRGSGQGLAISRSVIVDKHQGTLSVETKVGLGSIFVIRLPLYEGDEGRKDDAN